MCTQLVPLHRTFDTSTNLEAMFDRGSRADAGLSHSHKPILGKGAIRSKIAIHIVVRRILRRREGVSVTVKKLSFLGQGQYEMRFPS